MRNIVLFFFLTLTFNNLSAQSLNNDEIVKEKKLTEAEFIIAKKKYIEMTESQTYISVKRLNWEFNENLKGLELPSVKDIVNWQEDENIMREWWSDKLKETKYENVDEPINALKKIFELTRKQFDENKELYDLMKKASFDQLKEIMEPERLFFGYIYSN